MRALLHPSCNQKGSNPLPPTLTLHGNAAIKRKQRLRTIPNMLQAALTRPVRGCHADLACV